MYAFITSMYFKSTIPSQFKRTDVNYAYLTNTH